MAHSYSHLFGLPTTGLRFFTVYGPWGRPDHGADAVHESDPRRRADPACSTSGRMRRDFTYVDDIVEGVVRTLARPPTARDGGAALRDLQHRQPRSGASSTTFIDTLERLLGRAAMRDYQPMQPGDVPATYASIDRLRAATGFAPQHAARRRPRPLRRLVSRLSSSALTAATRLRAIELVESPPEAGHRPAVCVSPMILVTGGAGFIGANFVLDWLAAVGRAARQSRQAHLRRQPRQPAIARAGRRATCSCAAISAMRRSSVACCAAHRPRAIVNFAAESARRSLDPRARSVHRDQRRRHLRAARRGHAIGGRRCRRRARRHFASSTCRPTRSTARSDRDRSGVHRDDRVCAEQSVLGVEGRVRPSGARLSPHVRAADAHDQLLEQLRSAPVSRRS